MSNAPHLPWLSNWQLRALIVSIAIALLAYLAFALWSGWRDFALALGKVGIAGTALACTLSLANYALRFARWQMYLSAMGHRIPTLASLRIYLAGFLLTTTPAKAGEAIRGVLLRPWRVPYPISLAAFLSERLSDLLAIVLLSLIGLSGYPRAYPLIAVGAAAIIAAFVMIANQSALHALQRSCAHRGRSGKLLSQLIDILLQARQCHAPVRLLIATMLSLVAWSAEALALWLILHWMGIDVALSFAMFAYAAAMLAGALSFMPGGLGGAEAAMVALLMWTGVDPASATAATVLIRLATLWFAVALGAIAALTSEAVRKPVQDCTTGDQSS